MTLPGNAGDAGDLMPDGIPSPHAYRELINCREFKEMEEFSNNFLESNNALLESYKAKWVADPLHQWSRQWEYPYVYSRVMQAVQNRVRPVLLDAGSGVTFFPYYLSSRIKDVSLKCCDYDRELENSYRQINANRKKSIDFLAADLRGLPYEAESFHAIYCISVLEHTANYKDIIDEFFRILRPGGSLIITFDVSLDGSRSIDVDKGNALIAALATRFAPSESLSLDLHSHISKQDIFTSLKASRIDVNLLPWKPPSLFFRFKRLLSGQGSWVPPLTVFCISLRKA